MKLIHFILLSFKLIFSYNLNKYLKYSSNKATLACSQYF